MSAFLTSTSISGFLTNTQSIKADLGLMPNRTGLDASSAISTQFTRKKNS